VFSGENRLPMPMNIHRMLTNITTSKTHDKKSTTVQDTINDTPLVDSKHVFKTVLEFRKFVTKKTGKWKKSLFGILLSSVLSSNSIIKYWKLTKPNFDYLMDIIYQRYHVIAVAPGENVGVIAAQSIGEPATQMTLNVSTFFLNYR
jgi:DNA-directed RNA polymerase II subunit RPB1